MSEGKTGLSIAADHPAFAGHFPAMPVVPGVVLLDEALHAIGIRLGKDLSACRINSVKFLSPAQPGEPLEVQYELLGSGAIQFTITSMDRKIAVASVRPTEAMQ